MAVMFAAWKSRLHVAAKMSYEYTIQDACRGSDPSVSLMIGRSVSLLLCASRPSPSQHQVNHEGLVRNETKPTIVWYLTWYGLSNCIRTRKVQCRGIQEPGNIDRSIGVPPPYLIRFNRYKNSNPCNCCRLPSSTTLPTSHQKPLS